MEHAISQNSIPKGRTGVVMELQGAILVPFMGRQKFAEVSGVEEGVVNGWIKNGLLPTVKVGKHRMVNTAALWAELSKEEWER